MRTDEDVASELSPESRALRAKLDAHERGEPVYALSTAERTKRTGSPVEVGTYRREGCSSRPSSSLPEPQHTATGSASVAHPASAALRHLRRHAALAPAHHEDVATTRHR
jgi:hypothetical protein